MPENASLPNLRNTSKLSNRIPMPTWLGCCSSYNFLPRAYDHHLESSSTFPLVGWLLFLRNIPISRARCLLEAWDEWFPQAWFDAWTLRTMIRWLKSEQYGVKQFVFCSSSQHWHYFWKVTLGCLLKWRIICFIVCTKKGGFQPHWRWNLSKNNNKVNKFWKKKSRSEIIKK